MSLHFQWIALSLLLPCWMVGQTANEWQERYPFLQVEANQIQLPGGGERMEGLLQRLDQLAFAGKGQLSILHIGGSHVQAGMLSSAMRSGLQNLHPGLKGNRGFFFPFRLAGTNEPANYSIQASGNWEGFRCSVRNHEARWGLSGITAETSDAYAEAHIDAFDGDSARYTFQRIRIFHPAGPNYFQPVVADSSLLPDSCFYDARGFTEFRFAYPQDHFHFRLGGDSTASEFIWQGVQYLDDLPGISYHAIGVNGASTESYLRCQDFAMHLEAVAPDLVIFGIGINDAYGPADGFDPSVFARRYDSLMTAFEAANPKVVFLFMTNNDSYYRRRFPNPNALKVQTTMYQLATVRDGGYWDLFQLMGGLGSIDAWLNKGLAKKDRIHLSREGYSLQAALFTEAFAQLWLQHLRANNAVEP